MTKKFNISDLHLDENNANRGTDRGKQLLEQSLKDLGAGRSILIDKNNRVIAGNKTTEAAIDIGLKDVLIVETIGDKLIAIKRTDLDLQTDSKARALAYSDNRVAQLDLDWDVEQILKDIDLISVENLWTEDELERLQDGADLSAFEAIAAGNESEDEASDAEDKTTADKTDSEMLPFHCLLTQEQREHLFQAINKAKSKHRLETTADALDAIAEEYLK